MYSKADIFNLALGALLLTRRITNTDTDKSNECTVLNIHWKTAYAAALQEMDLDGTSSQQVLELVTADPYQTQTHDGLWKFAYKYPSNCMFFRRIQSCVRKDNRSTHIPKRIAIYQGQKVIFTNQEGAIAELIPNDIPLTALSAAAGLAVAYKLATLASALVTGKGANTLRTTIDTAYKIARAEAQAQDQQENFTYEPEWVESEFVEARMS